MPRFARLFSSSGTPWSPLSVSAIALLLPAGGAVLTIQNLLRLRVIEPEQAKQLMFAAIGVFAVGIVVLLQVDLARSGGASGTSDATGVLGGGMAIVSYLVQRAPFRAWRVQHTTVRTASFLGAVGTAVLFSLLTLCAAVPVMVVALLAGGASAS